MGIDNRHAPYYRRWIAVYKMAGNVPEPFNDRRIGTIMINVFYPDALQWDSMKGKYYAVTEGGVR